MEYGGTPLTILKHTSSVLLHVMLWMFTFTLSLSSGTFRNTQPLVTGIFSKVLPLLRYKLEAYCSINWRCIAAFPVFKSSRSQQGTALQMGRVLLLDKLYGLGVPKQPLHFSVRVSVTCLGLFILSKSKRLQATTLFFIEVRFYRVTILYDMNSITEIAFALVNFCDHCCNVGLSSAATCHRAEPSLGLFPRIVKPSNGISHMASLLQRRLEFNKGKSMSRNLMHLESQTYISQGPRTFRVSVFRKEKGT